MEIIITKNINYYLDSFCFCFYLFNIICFYGFFFGTEVDGNTIVDSKYFIVKFYYSLNGRHQFMHNIQFIDSFFSACIGTKDQHK